MTTKVAKTYEEIRQVGYDDGVDNERILVISYLRGQAEEMRKMKFDEKARLLIWCAEDIEHLRHLSQGGK